MTTFQRKLIEEIREQDLTIYALARLIDAENPEPQERNLRRWLSQKNPTRPSDASLRALALALGKDADFFVSRCIVDTDPIDVRRTRRGRRIARIIRSDAA